MFAIWTKRQTSNWIFGRELIDSTEVSKIPDLDSTIAVTRNKKLAVRADLDLMGERVCLLSCVATWVPFENATICDQPNNFICNRISYNKLSSDPADY